MFGFCAMCFLALFVSVMTASEICAIRSKAQVIVAQSIATCGPCIKVTIVSKGWRYDDKSCDASGTGGRMNRRSII